MPKARDPISGNLSAFLPQPTGPLSDRLRLMSHFEIVKLVRDLFLQIDELESELDAKSKEYEFEKLVSTRYADTVHNEYEKAFDDMLNSPSTRAWLNNRARLAKDPKQLAISKIKTEWKAWKNGELQFKSQAAFARSMQEKYSVLEDTRAIERHVTKWEKSRRGK